MAVHPKGTAIMSPGRGWCRSHFGVVVGSGTDVHGTPAAYSDAFLYGQRCPRRKGVFYATGFMGYFYISHLTFIIGFGAIMLVGANPAYKRCGGRADWRQ